MIMENRHTVLGSFWHESINNNSGDWSNQSTRGLPFCLFSFFLAYNNSWRRRVSLGHDSSTEYCTGDDREWLSGEMRRKEDRPTNSPLFACE